MLAVVALGPSGAGAGAAEVKLDRDYLAGLVEKRRRAPFAKAGQYRGSGAPGRSGSRRSTRGRGGSRSPARSRASSGRRSPARVGIPDGRAVTPASTRRRPSPSPRRSRGRRTGWKSFPFVVRASVFAEPGPDGVPRFRVDVDEVKRRELEGVAGALAKVLGRHFDGIVTRCADGKASTMNAN